MEKTLPIFSSKNLNDYLTSNNSLGRGLNHSWTYGLSVSYGTAGSSSGLSVYNPIFNSRENALSAALSILKQNMLEKLGNSDTTNYSPKIISATLKDIAQFKFAKT
ncbi:MAG: hypothetical protein EOO90_13895 [Pedobacter sp.]|nr:MAG: hypothetical protein EOO90_13895 [Pedobacter sp.]